MARKKKEEVEVPVEPEVEAKVETEEEAFKRRHTGAREGVIYE